MIGKFGIGRPVVFFVLVGLCGQHAFGQIRQEEPSESTKPAYKPSPDEKKPDIAKAVEIIVQRTNAFRKEQKREPVQSNAQLTKTAQDFADFMASTDKYGHNADGKQPADRAKEHGYEFCLVSENIAYRFNSEGLATNELGEGFFTGWKNSEGHRKNMLEPDATETGVAIARSSKSGYYYGVQMFGRPKSLMIEFRIANQSDATVKYELGGETFELRPRYIRTHQFCSPEELSVAWPDSDETAKWTIRANERLAVVREDNGALRLKREDTLKPTPNGPNR